jgi:ABC-2 type transport system ATP-binding protein
MMITTEDLTKKFDDFLAVEGVNLKVAAGEILVLLGPNGAGKTTTVRMLTSILIPSRGRAWVAGYDVVTQAQKVRASVGVLTENHGLYGRMNALEYLEFFGMLYGIQPSFCRRRINDLLENFGLSFARKKRLGEYSKGMRQKLALVRALLHSPPVLLLDEPTSAMDPESARFVRDEISGLRSGDRAIVLCTHNLAEAEELADQVAIIRNGKIILNDTIGGVKHKLLGPIEFEIKLNQSIEGWGPTLPLGVSVSGRGVNWLRFRVENPDQTNPILLAEFLRCGLGVVTFQEVRYSLERAYLEAVSRHEESKIA